MRLKDRLGPDHSEFILPVRQSKDKTIVLKIMGNHSKARMATYMIKSGAENVTLLCGKQTVVNRLGLRDEQLVQLHRALLLRRALHVGLNALAIAILKFLILSLNLF